MGNAGEVFGTVLGAPVRAGLAAWAAELAAVIRGGIAASVKAPR